MRSNITTCLLVGVICLDRYWSLFVGSSWRWHFRLWNDEGKQLTMSAEQFMSDLSEFVQIFICFIILNIWVERRLYGLNMWWLYICYVLWSIIDFALYQSQTDYNIRQISGAIIVICEIIYVIKRTCITGEEEQLIG